MLPRHQRILHIDGDAFFASCETALDPTLRGQPVFVGGGRRGDGIVIAANYLAKQYGITTGMACFEAKRACPTGVLVKPHYDEYRRLSLELFQRVRRYTPLLVPYSIDEGFLDFTDAPRVFRCRDAGELVKQMKKEIVGEIGIPVSAGLGSSRLLAKLATEYAKPDGFFEVPADQERAFLQNISVDEVVGVAERRARRLRALGVWTLGDVTRLPLEIIRKRLGFFGLQLWLLARGELRENLKLEHKSRTCIGSATTLPQNEPDHETALLFLLDQAERLIATLVQENLKPRELGIHVRFPDLNGKGMSARFPAAQHNLRVIEQAITRMYRQLLRGETQPIRQVCVHFWNLEPLNLEHDLFGFNPDVKRAALQDALRKIEAQFGPRRVKTGTRLLLETQAPHLTSHRPKCPFIPQREMELNVGKLPPEVLDLVYQEEWTPLDTPPAADPLALPRTWGRSTARPDKFN